MRYIICLNPVRPAARRPIAAACVAIYLATWIGLPLPVDLLAETLVSEPYPCQGHHCGCRNAEECWRHCCCFTMAERLAWAKAHNVTPPAWVRATLPAEPVIQAEPGIHAEPHRCCSHCGRQCAKCPSGIVAAPRATQPKSSGDRWLSVITAQRCRGASVDWIASGAVLLPPTIRQLKRDTTIGEPPGFAAIVAAPVPQLPPVPPPRA